VKQKIFNRVIIFKNSLRSLRKYMKKLIVANWKMNPASLKEALSLFTATKSAGSLLRNVQTVVCVPFLYISELQKKISGHRVVLGAQDAFPEKSGSFTGEVSIDQLKKAGVKYVIVGHSERRAMGEANADVAKKTQAVLRAGLSPIVCIGEHERDEHAEYLSYIRQEVRESLAGISAKDSARLIIAYEPLWAIGSASNRADTPEGTMETVLYIRKVLAEFLPKKTALSLPMLYGGSVNSKNALGFLLYGGVQGLLIGRASLQAKEFTKLLKSVDVSA